MENIIYSIKDNMQKFKLKFISLQEEKKKYTNTTVDFMLLVSNIKSLALASKKIAHKSQAGETEIASK